MSEMLPELQESFKILSNIPSNRDELIESFANLGVIHSRLDVGPLALLSLAFNEKWIDTINLPISPLHQKVRDIELQIKKARKFGQLKEKKKGIEERLADIGKNEEKKQAMDEARKLYQEIKDFDRKIEEADEQDVSLLCLFFARLCLCCVLNRISNICVFSQKSRLMQEKDKVEKVIVSKGSLNKVYTTVYREWLDLDDINSVLKEWESKHSKEVSQYFFFLYMFCRLVRFFYNYIHITGACVIL